MLNKSNSSKLKSTRDHADFPIFIDVIVKKKLWKANFIAVKSSTYKHILQQITQNK